MRALPLVVGLALATALVSLAPGAVATGDVCVNTPDNPFAQVHQCVVASCSFRSDCCQTSFWCPETE